jgi:SAM-dependent methyltransferase
MSTQYDKIGTAYNALKTLPPARMERSLVRETVAPYVAGARVLDLACGTGYYAGALLDWGAAEVVGMDISREMVAAATAATTAAGGAQRCTFVVGDASEPFELLAGGPFDLVLGVWLLNYAASGEVMTQMWSNIARHLRPDGGVFVGLTPPPESGVEAVRASAERHSGPIDGITVDIVGPVPDGFRMRMVVQGQGQGQDGDQDDKFEFENYHLVKEVYETSARQGGMRGAFTWRPIRMPRDPAEVQRLAAGLDDGYWDRYLRDPHCGVCVVER